MTILIRKVNYNKNWATVVDPQNLPQAMPGWAVAEFIPSARDDGGLSVFSVENEADALEVAAANHFSGVDISEKYQYIGAQEADICSEGFSVYAEESSFNRTDVDKWHRIIKVNTIEKSLLLAGIFFKSSIIYLFSPNVLTKSIETAAREDKYDYIRALNNSQPQKLAISFIRGKVVTVAGRRL